MFDMTTNVDKGKQQKLWQVMKHDYNSQSISIAGSERCIVMAPTQLFRVLLLYILLFYDRVWDSGFKGN